ncbi:tRNA1(Val) (adenine(37)-N6)-methyltransferase [Alteromonas sp. 38]|nr:tRNA1(Val) (adenine(37)-N6)-methyltransferase [Alteromonas sp. 154]VXC35163.1 tRNA1(Val) (adenine(37)-N6)-methyltransferase [Alteromonas sp. 38]
MVVPEHNALENKNIKRATMFRCKQFVVNQTNCAMKVNTDSMILGSWAKPNQSSHILDIGTGTGILALMMAQTSAPSAKITAIDIDEKAASQARLNVAASPWPTKITVQHNKLSDLAADNAFDFIVSNPPYFEHVKGHSHAYKSQSDTREQARQTVSLTPAHLFSFVTEQLTSTGEFYCLYPFARESEIIGIAAEIGLVTNRILRVQHNDQRPPYVTVFCMSKQHKKSDIDNLVIRDESGDYSSRFKALCRDFYLRF